MSERGVFAVDRGVFDHDCFADEPFTEREAWMWLIGEAAWKPRTRRVGHAVVSLERGQLAASVRFMADKWQWSKSRVERFLDRLRGGKSCRGGRPAQNPEKPPSETGALIETQSGTGVLVITICNYAKYQRVSLPTGTDTGTQSGTDAGQMRDKTEDIKYIEPKNIAQGDWPSDFRDQFWKAYPRRLGKQGALRELERVRKRGDVPFARLMGAVKSYAATADPQFTKHPQTWLSKGCWDDELPTKIEPTLHTIMPTSPNWNIWRSHYRDTGQNFRVTLMDKSASDGKPFTVPSEQPPARGQAA